MSASAGTSQENAAEAAARAGRMDEAARLWSAVLSREPANSRALLFLGQHTLFRGDARTAAALLDKACTADPGNAVAWLNLSFAHRALGDSAAELKALGQALAADPCCYPALLAKGDLLQRLGRSREAARVYHDGLAITPRDDLLAEPLRRAAARARDAVAENAKALRSFLDGRLAPHRRSRNARFDECQAIAVGQKTRFVQEASVLLVPQLAAIPFYDTAQFPWLADIAAATDVIREELLQLLMQDSAGFAPYVQHPEGVPLNQWRELNHSPKWSAFFLFKDGVRQDENCMRCPRTAQAIEAMPLASMEGYAPTVFFSTLEPHTRIPPHTGATNARLIVHLPLIVPDNCSFRVGNETRLWREGEPLVFDDTIEHEAFNNSDRLRVVMIFDIWNPFLTEEERELIPQLLVAMRDYYSAG